MKQVFLLSIFSIFCLTVTAQTKTWVGPSGGSFNLATNWNPAGIPGATHDIIIPTGSDMNIDGGAASVKSFDLQGNAKMTIINHLTTSMASSISSNAIITWNEGNLSGAGTITNNGTINLMTSVTKNMTTTLTLINNRTINVNGSGDFIVGYGNPTLNNTSSGTINLNSTGQITYSQGIGSLINSGVIKKIQDNGIFEINTNFTNNKGTISVEKGTLKLNSGNASLIDGIYNVTSGSILELASSFKLLGTLTGKLDGQLNWTGDLKVEPATEAILNFTGPSGVNWSDRYFTGNGTLTNNGILNLTSSNGKIVSGTSTLKNNATLNVNSSGDFTLSGNSTLNNTTSGTINLNSTGQITYTQGVGSFINSGLIKKVQDNGVYEINANFTNNKGTISVENGTLKLNSVNASLIDGIYNVTSGSILELANNFKLSGTLIGKLDGQLNWTGDLKVEPTTEAILNFTGPSGVNWSDRYFTGNGTLTNNGILNLTSSNGKIVSGTSTLKNNATLNVNSTGDFILSGNSTLNNTTSGTINLHSTGQITYTQGVGSLINSGVIKKIQDNGVCEINANFTNNKGTISVEKGTLKLNSGNASLIDGIYNVTSGSILELASSFKLSGTLTGKLDGQLNWTGDLKVEPATEANLNFTGPSGVNWSDRYFTGNGTLTNNGILNLTSLNGKIVSGTSTLKNNATLNVNSTGDFILSGNSTLENTTSGTINLNTTGQITYFQGIGSLINSGLIKKEGTNGTFAISANTNNISPGKIICENGLLTFGTYTGNGILGGNASVQLQNNTIFEGTISPGGLPGILTYIGNYKSSANTILASEIYGTTSGTQYDVFNVQGTAVMNGIVKVDLKYAAKVNDEFVILTANSITSCNLPATVTAAYDSHSYIFDVICNPNNVTLKLSSIILGIGDNELSNNLSLYPNPSNGHFTLDLGKDYTDVTVQISNTLGQIISSIKYASAKIIENEINDSQGIHFVNVKTATGESTTLKVLNQ